MERIFHLKENGTTVKTEILAASSRPRNRR